MHRGDDALVTFDVVESERAFIYWGLARAQYMRVCFLHDVAAGDGETELRAVQIGGFKQVDCRRSELTDAAMLEWRIRIPDAAQV